MKPIRVLTILEARSVHGAVKPVFEFAREAAGGALPAVQLSMLTFIRGGDDNEFTRAVAERGLPLFRVRERSAFDLSVLSQLREIVGRERPDVIWTHSVKSHFLVRLAGLPRQARWVAYHHGYTVPALRTRVYNQLDRWSHRGADRVITVCRDFAALLERQGVARERLRVQPVPIRPAVDGVPESTVRDLRSRLQLPGEAAVILTVGRLSREKGHADLLRSFARLRAMNPGRDLRLVIVGEGPELDGLRQLRTSLGLDAVVVFTGQQSVVRPYYAMSDVFVLPSHSEGSPNVLLEAMDARLPVVATAVGGVPEIATHERDALLVPARDSLAMANALNRVLVDEGLRERLKLAAVDVLARHTPAQFYQSIAGIFAELVG